MTEENLHETVDRLAEDEELVLQCLDNGFDDVHEITQATRLNKDEVNNRYGNLEDLGLIEVGESQGMVERVVDGSRQVFQEPKPASLTERGETVLDVLEQDRIEEYQRLSQDELAAKVVELEYELEEMREQFESFRQQVQTMVYGQGEE